MRELDNQTVLQMNHIMKIYGNGVVANEDVSLDLRADEPHHEDLRQWCGCK